ncbi:hypothetical protein DI09_35p100 [Mitosporidium daphniae]|uniref:2-oxoisovalerate dehydrogenase subunit alpha n=1 Tax=Mitosporidium daphniae TaxID=1485682 RepID=A0A098VQY5_9MICR|nr:uncharacterized protein DI09_35p100 [Mitosporidium daphniae]KGG51422.1 hypothetical protein DI09_35p100 [Mitosporidium daphniae]|eukprot:XP_013237849.1 uncharacterized protein DI09_35p100 [Mitosporidium daphniae]
MRFSCSTRQFTRKYGQFTRNYGQFERNYGQFERNYGQFAKFPHDKIPYTNRLKPTFDPSDPEYKVVPAYRVLPLETIPHYISKNVARQILVTMIKNRVLDSILYNLQRQGKIAFYMTSLGEEAAIVASTAALADEDVIFTQYREQASFLYRGFSLQNLADQLFSNEADSGKGRQMPLHYGSITHNIHTVSSVLATQLPHAVGSAYSLKMNGTSNCEFYIGKKQYQPAILAKQAQAKGISILH